MVSRYALLRELAAILPEDALVVCSIGNNSGFWGQIAEREADLFHLTMGMCTPAALGLALALPRRKVVALDGDGNLLLNLGVLGTVGNERPENLTIVVFNNRNYLGSHKREPGMPTATAGKVDLEAVARACGIASAWTVTEAESFAARVRLALAGSGPHLINALVSELDDERPERARKLPDPRENKYRFARYIERTEGVEILGGGLGRFG
jgi:sulfopyruvate decarboxylase subunit beta